MSLLAFVSSKLIMGGKLVYVIFMLLVAFFLTQYLADTIYLYQSIHETWSPVSLTDILYVNTYFIMGVSMYLLSKNI
jgi:hypothetical protein